MKLYHYPEKAKVAKTIPKNAFYQHGGASCRIEQLFIQEVESITWAYKLAASSLPMDETDKVKEVQIFHIQSRVPDISEDILHFIDKSIPSPIIFEVYYQDTLTLSAAYKRPNRNNSAETVLYDYYHQKVESNHSRLPLPSFLTIQGLYEHLIEQILPIRVAELGSREQEDNTHSIEEKLQQAEEVQRLQEQLIKLKRQLAKERQFNHKVELNLRIQEIELKLSSIRD
ncbi:hypothetical protein V757_10810 [Pelistega indica]|uniref:Methyl-accepting chemotaxis protein n=1 Tax=Pelistega indica TaxID=1414851 RepID=V8FVI5_9BURK|nr:DUF4391 domain-containing protein [Pelistega indica]ETD67886.1 hypothetical protein V757_10810 [Pelistega indica]